ncbi:MAG: type II toxin-antitoxin system PemK/MazF family toxin [Chloroflexi bacterium]|nr:type II toxin-antitoxin system PemK/MazF family toxin [Chloroflexota bacterium]
MKRGEIWWADLGSPGSRRPVLLLSRNDAYAVRNLVLVAPVSTRVRGIPSELRLDAADGMPQECVANLEAITTIPKDSLSDRLATLSAGKLKELEAAARFALGME